MQSSIEADIFLVRLALSWPDIGLKIFEATLFPGQPCVSPPLRVTKAITK